MNDIKSFPKLFEVILKGTEEESRLAARSARKLVYSSNSKLKEISDLIDKAAVVYSGITEEFRQENFVMATSVMYFLHNREVDPDFLFPWFFQLLQHTNGYIRYAAVRMIENDLGPLTVHIRCPEQKGLVKFSSEKADKILFGLRTNLNNLLSASWKPSYNKCKYISDLPSSTYKSAQLVLDYLDECYEEGMLQNF